MKLDWLWDRKISLNQIKKIFLDRDNPQFVPLAALLLSRKNSISEVFRDYIKRKDFFLAWSKIKKQMRKNSWNDPRIKFWQAVYDTLKEDPQFAKLREAELKGPLSRICREIGIKIKEARNKANLTQKELAQKLKVSQQVISRIESGRQNVSLETLNNLVSSLGFSLDIELK